MLKRSVVCLMVVMTLLVLSVAPAAAKRPSKGRYEYYLRGNGQNVVTSTSSGLMLAGGGTDQDTAMQWMINKSGGGDFVVIRTSGSDAYNPYIYDLGNVDSVETIIIKNLAAANDQFVYEKIRNAEALFITGGDQATYVEFWKGTLIEDAIHELISKNVPIGGTSAGMAVLGEHVFDAMNGTVYSYEALENPYNRYMSFTNDFLVIPNMTNIITDTHFGRRDRMGRSVGFIARMVKDGWAPANNSKAICCDEGTVLCIEANGVGRVYGTGNVYFLRTTEAPLVCQSGLPLEINNVSVYKIDSSSSKTFNISTWTGSGGTSYSLDAADGQLTSSIGSIY